MCMWRGEKFIDGAVKGSPACHRAVLETVEALRKEGHECIQIEPPDCACRGHSQILIAELSFSFQLLRRCGVSLESLLRTGTKSSQNTSVLTRRYDHPHAITCMNRTQADLYLYRSRHSFWLPWVPAFLVNTLHAYMNCAPRSNRPRLCPLIC